ncbi:glutathione S-transferase [Pseudomonas sp. CDFA 602]|uniref:glutathione S-transferase N-terminal domain-containing protein n=1 Tax=Pseudomonas californiensis TaxID=2829823 RepID=UPI001E4061AD|nr:glutathione S-transferase [Pseudomonas californiensis]MCD5994830.1 glutathione S-transferase [Pseudomonas californiensis]MCD6000539.1 glutathione S-transferase [Pseudomonas californiensis]
MYTLFGAEGSGSVAIEIALGRCNVCYTLIPACAWEEGSDKEALEQANPLVQVPTLILPDGSVMTESVAILIHLGLEFPESGLLPRSVVSQAHALRALVYIAANCYSAIGIIDHPERWMPDTDQVSLTRLEEGARLRLYEHWETFSDVFVQPDFWRPDAPGAVEVLAAVVTRWSGTREHLQMRRPEFHVSLLQIDAHPTVKPVAERQWA